MEKNLNKGSRKSVKSEALDYIQLDSRTAPGKKKVKSKKKKVDSQLLKGWLFKGRRRGKRAE